jgi:hypothetical protein
MRIVLKVSSNNEYCDGGCEFALVLAWFYWRTQLVTVVL